MKKTITMFVAIFMLVTFSTKLNAQFITDGVAATNQYGKTDAFPANQKIYAIGIGDFTNFVPRAALHVNTNLLDVSTDFTSGEVFRTTGPTAQDNSWRMFTGTGNGTERFSISTLANSDDAVLSTAQNGAMMFNTNSIERMHINGNKTLGVANAIDGFSVNTSGFVGIGPNTGNLWHNTGPFTLLHLNGETAPGDFAQQWGYRPWMRTGISFTDQVDYSYVGYRSVDASANLNEFTISWGNDLIPASSPISAGPDDMVFRFVAAIGDDVVPNPPTGDRGSADFSTNDDFDGRHIARFTPLGFFGLGPNFGHTIDNAAYVRPQSMFHMSSYQQQDAWMQVTNQTGTSETANDGLRIGVTGTGTAHIKQQEELPLILYTGATELMRLIPANNTTPAMVGIGNFSTTTPYIGAKLDIDGDLRIRTVTQDNALTQVLVIDPNDHNRVHWRSVSSIGGGGTGGTVTADNGLRINPSASNVQLGGPLVINTDINLSTKSLIFSGTGRMGIGALSTSKLTIKNDLGSLDFLLLKNSQNSNVLKIMDDGQTTFNITNHNAFTVQADVNNAGHNVNGKFVTNALSGAAINSETAVTGVSSITSGDSGPNSSHRSFSASPRNHVGENIAYHLLIRGDGAPMFGENRGLSGFIENGVSNYGIDINARFGSFSNYGARLNATTTSGDPNSIDATNYGVSATASFGKITYGGKFHASGATDKNYGIYVTVSGPPSGTTPPSGPNYAGYFAGDVYISGTFGGPSDLMLKDNLNEINNASNIINQLQPKTFDYKQSDFPNMNLSSGLQYGLIAQDVETILPDLITEVTQPAELDSLGNVVTPEINFKGLEYQQLIPILIAGFKEQQSELDTKDSLIDNLQSEINYIKECLLNARICEEGNRTINQNPTTETNQKSIELINTNSIILDQNLPNPFAENTVINYNIPDNVMEAKLMFYDFNGRIIKELIIEERGESRLTVYGTNLKTGVYTYSLVADGELIATKKMVKKR